MTKNYLERAPLPALIGDSAALRIVETPTGRAPREIEQALEKVMADLCPYPALRINDWFWQTKAGQTVCRAQWEIYQFEAIRPFQACRILWGSNSKKSLKRLVTLRTTRQLAVYWFPKEVAAYWPSNDQIEAYPTYCRRGDVMRLREKGKYVGHTDLFKPSKRPWARSRDADPYQKAYRPDEGTALF